MDANTSLVRLHIKFRQINSRQQTDAEIENIFRIYSANTLGGMIGVSMFGFHKLCKAKKYFLPTPYKVRGSPTNMTATF